MRRQSIVYVTVGEPRALKPLYSYHLVSHVSQTIVYVMFGEPFALIPLYLQGLVNHVSPTHCIGNVW